LGLIVLQAAATWDAFSLALMEQSRVRKHSIGDYRGLRYYLESSFLPRFVGSDFQCWKLEAEWDWTQLFSVVKSIACCRFYSKK
jgi:hypothetical protein